MKITPIGGSHPIQPISDIFENFKKDILVTNARSALYSILQALGTKKIWVPSYLCESILHDTYDLKFYEVNEKLKPNKTFIKKIKKNDVVLVMNYFGISPENDFIEEIKDKKAICIEDSAQSLFSKGELADYTFYSLTKSTGLPDGGAIRSKNKLKLNLIDPPFENIYKKIEYKFLKKSFDNGFDNDWYNKYLNRNTEPTGMFSISSFSKNLVNKIDLNIIRKKNKENFKFLSEKLTPFIEPKEDEVPLGFPITTKKRDEVLKHLIENKIYPAIHWKLSKVPKHFEQSYKLSKSELTIPCDWRYSENDMERIIKCLSKISY